MGNVIQLGNIPLVPLKEAVDLVPYSRDYIARLAREGKIVALHVDRQWMVEPVSLQNFFQQAKLEEGVRHQHLRELRKFELEVKEDFSKRIDALNVREQSVPVMTHVQTVAVVLCGLAAGAFFYVTAMTFGPDHLNQFAQVPQNLFTSLGHEKAIAADDFSHISTHYLATTEITTSMDISEGIVLVPASSAPLHDVREYFSDEVTVTMVDSTSGVIHLEGAPSASLPFVLVPDTAQTENAVLRNSP